MQAPARRSTRKDRGENIRVTGTLLRKAAKRGYVRRPQAAPFILPVILEASPYSDFITISNLRKRENNLVISIFQDGTFSLNSSLLQYLPERKVEIKLKQDCSQLAIIKKGNMKIDLGKNGRIKNYDIIKRLEKQKKKFPIYYVGSWDEQEEIWIGNLTTNNPNKRNVRRKKNIK